MEHRETRALIATLQATALANNCYSKNFTLLGTIRRHRREIPPIFKAKADFYSSRFLFNHNDDICLVAYQAKKKNSLMLLNSSHNDATINNEKNTLDHRYHKL